MSPVSADDVDNELRRVAPDVRYCFRLSSRSSFLALAKLLLRVRPRWLLMVER